MNTGWSIDDLVQYCLEEIAWDGAQGSNKERIWEFATNYIRLHTVATIRGENSMDCQKNQLDATLQDYLWQSLINRPQLTCTTESSSSSNDTTDNKSSTVKTSKKQKSSNTPTAMNTLYADGEERLIADYTYRRRLIAGASDGTSITDTNWRVLEAVARRRERGITQVELHQILHIGAQSVFHIIKQLSILNLVKKVNLVFQKNNTNLCLHTHFAPLNDSYRAQLISIKQKQASISNKRKREEIVESEREKEGEEIGEELTAFTAALRKGQTQEKWQSNLVRQGVTDILATVPNRTLSIKQLRQALVIKYINLLYIILYVYIYIYKTNYYLVG
ncbi:hypothetical protein BDF19DRAFT_284898 [Syncephalis fuscata]|nr:hypothetical protein BDF19DRAFT_284898 [Syncephalis fuscata]